MISGAPKLSTEQLSLPAPPVPMPPRPSPAPASETARKPRRGREATDAVRAHAERLGMTGPLGDDVRPPGASLGGERMVRLEQDLLADASLAWDTPRLATSLVWLESFLRDGRTMFVDCRGPLAAVGVPWNRRSLDLLTRHITSSPPLGRTRGEHVSYAVAQSYTSAIYLLRCREANYDIAPAEQSFVAPLVAKTTKRKEPPPGTRALSMGLRAIHFLAAAAAGFDRTSDRGGERWAAGLLAHNLLLRGGEVGVSDDAHPEPHRILRGRSITWQRPARGSRGRLWALVWVVPIKDPLCTHRGHPCPIARRHDGPFGADPLCPYDALARVWWQRMGRGRPFPVDARGHPLVDWHARTPAALLHAPLFMGSDGEVWRTSTSRQLFRDIAAAAGLDPLQFGAKAGRIGGATDARERAGPGGADTVRRRGRWGSDVAEIYQRKLLAVQLDLSATLGEAISEDLEQMCSGWAQPAR